MDRHARQARLAGVGPEGQERLGRAVVEVRLEGLAAEVAARYLAGAGVGGLRVPGEDVARAARAVDARVSVAVAPAMPVDEEPAPAGFEHPASAEVARGALLALRAIRAVLEGAP